MSKKTCKFLKSPGRFSSGHVYECTWFRENIDKPVWPLAVTERYDFQWPPLTKNMEVRACRKGTICPCYEERSK